MTGYQLQSVLIVGALCVAAGVVAWAWAWAERERYRNWERDPVHGRVTRHEHVVHHVDGDGYLEDEDADVDDNLDQEES